MAHNNKVLAPESPTAVEIAHLEAQKRASLRNWFSGFATASAGAVGSPFSFLAAIAIIVAWAVTGPIYHYSDTWQLIINTGTTIVTFLMVFLIQNTQNRDAKAIHLKLNELVYSMKAAHNELVDVEKLTDEELKQLDAYYTRIREECSRRDKMKDVTPPAAA
jgi:low affinity Fe/Cu permease